LKENVKKFTRKDTDMTIHTPQNAKHSKIACSYAKRGYSLVEMAVVIALIGLLMGSALTIGGSKVERKNLVSTDASLDDVEAALIAFYRNYKRLPCPASPTLAESDANFGVEDTCSGATPTRAGVVQLNDTTADEQWVGTVPTRTLGLPDSKMFDVWGSRLVYAVDKDFADSTKTFDSEVADNAATAFRINDKAGNQINPADLQSPVIYVLLSLGKDKRGAFTKAGTQSITCDGTSTQRDGENCDSLTAATDSVFVDMDLVDSAIASEYYYDHIRWKTKQIFKGTYKPIVGVLPVFQALTVSDGMICYIGLDSRIRCSGHQHVASGAGVRLGRGGTAGDDGFTFATEFTNANDWVSIAGDYTNVCAFKVDRSMYCWGQNNYGQTSVDFTSAEIATPNTQARFKEVGDPPVDLGVGALVYGTDEGQLFLGVSDEFGCASEEFGVCWGRNNYGQLTNDTWVDKDIAMWTQMGDPGDTDNPDTVRMTSVGQEQACNILGWPNQQDDWEVHCWGRNNYGQLGINNTTNQNLMQQTWLPTDGWVTVSIQGGNHACALHKNGDAYCWGRNNVGQLGDGTTTNSSVPVQVAGKWNAIGAFEETTCGIQNGGEVMCWGNNASAGVTGSISGSITTPTAVPLPHSDFIYVASHIGNTCAVRANGELWCWGIDKGQYGTGFKTDAPRAPSQVMGVIVKTSIP
jgi:prepilin-type N-terminal cleavage/methylation domain-containing protein